MASVILSIISALALLFLFFILVAVITDSKLKTRHSLERARAIKIARGSVVLLLMTIFVIVLCFNFGKACSYLDNTLDSWWSNLWTTQEGSESVSGNSLEESESAEEDEAESAEANTAEPVETETTAADEETSAVTVASSATAVAEKVGKAVTEMAVSLQQEKTTVEPASTEEFIQKWMNVTNEEGLARFVSLFTVDTSGYVYPNMDKSELATKYNALRNYMGVSHYHLTSKNMNGIKQEIAKLYGLGKCGDMLVLPPETLEDWPWLYQVAGCMPVTADDLQGVDLSDDAVVKELLANRKKEVWDPKWEAMSEQQRNEQTLLATQVAILNDPRVGKAWLGHYAGMDFVYEASKGDIENMLKLYEDAYNLEGTDTETDAYGVLCFLEMITEKQFEAGELWRAGVNDLYFDNIGTHICELITSVNYENVGFKSLKSKRNYCLPMASSDVLRLPVEATYQESRLALVREQYDKDGRVMLRDGINRYDLRPEEFPIIVVTKKPPTTKTQIPTYNLLIEYKYGNVNGEKVAEPHSSQHKEGDAFRVLSPQPASYNAYIAVIEGYAGTLNNPYIIEGVMPKGNVHIVIVYTKKPDPPAKKDDPEDPDKPDPDKPDPDPDKPEPEDGEGAKDKDASSGNKTENDQGTGGEIHEEDGSSSGTGDYQGDEPEANDSNTGTEDTKHEGDTSKQPDPSSTAPAITGSDTNTTNNGDGTSTSITTPADASQDKNSGTLGKPVD